MTQNKQGVIFEIRAGAGGNEAGLFATDLFRMYSRYAQDQQWDVKILDSHSTSIGGLKQITFEVKGENIYSRMKNEGGVHRVQRIPVTEKSGRIHTSTVSVAILLRPEKNEEKEIKSSDLKIDTYRASGAGGQYVNKTETAIRITHMPTGIVVTSQTERNQLQNKLNAMSILKAKIFQKEQEEKLEKLKKTRVSQIGHAERVEKIRTYNFPQDRVTDHRIKKSWHKIEKIMEGKIGKMIKDLNKKLNQ